MLLAGKNYDPAAQVSKSTAAALAMTAFDTTNLRLTFTAPANGIVLVRICCTLGGASTFPTILLGVLEGSTVKARVSPIGALPGTATSSIRATQEALFTVSGLTPGASYTWDAAYGVETLVASTNIVYGGPNDTTVNNAGGGFQFEIYDAPNCLNSKLYDPATAVSHGSGAQTVLTALDTTNLRHTFTAPASGSVLVNLMGTVHGGTTFSQFHLGVLESTTVKGRVYGLGGLKTTAVATAMLRLKGQFVVTGLTPGASYTWDAAYAIETAASSSNFKYGGPNNATANDAYGGYLFEIWEV